MLESFANFYQQRTEYVASLPGIVCACPGPGSGLRCQECLDNGFVEHAERLMTVKVERARGKKAIFA